MENIKKKAIPIESSRIPKRIIKIQLKQVNKEIIETAEIKFVNIEEVGEVKNKIIIDKKEG